MLGSKAKDLIAHSLRFPQAIAFLHSWEGFSDDTWDARSLPKSSGPSLVEPTLESLWNDSSFAPLLSLTPRLDRLAEARALCIPTLHSGLKASPPLIVAPSSPPPLTCPACCAAIFHHSVTYPEYCATRWAPLHSPLLASPFLNIAVLLLTIGTLDTLQPCTSP